MASATRTQDHDEIREWVEERGGIPTIVKGTEGLLRIDFVRGAKSGGRESSLEEVSWDRWFELFDDNGLSFLHSQEKDNKFFKLVTATKEERQAAEDGGAAREEGAEDEEGAEGEEETVVLVTKEDDSPGEHAPR